MPGCGAATYKPGLKQMGMDFQVDTSYITDPKGKQIGHIEVVQDITARTKSVEYNRYEVEKLAANLEKLADGHLDMTFEVAEGDRYTENDRQNFTKINENFKIAIDSFGVYLTEISRRAGRAVTWQPDGIH